MVAAVVGDGAAAADRPRRRRRAAAGAALDRRGPAVRARATRRCSARSRSTSLAMTFGMPRALFAGARGQRLRRRARRAPGLLYAAVVGGRDGRRAHDRLARARAAARADRRSGRSPSGAWRSRWPAWPASLWLAAALLAVAGAADSVSAVCRSTINQTVTPDRMRGRMSSVFSLVVHERAAARRRRGGRGRAARPARAFSVSSGGLACVAGVGLIVVAVPGARALRRRRARAPRGPGRRWCEGGAAAERPSEGCVLREPGGIAGAPRKARATPTGERSWLSRRGIGR